MTFGPNDKAKITKVINEGVDVMREIATLREGLKDTVAALAEELDIEKKLLNKSIRIQYKQSQQNQNTLEDMQEELDSLEELLKAAGAKV
jgi:phage host-nuclease inhibitor protein Gam